MSRQTPEIYWVDAMYSSVYLNKKYSNLLTILVVKNVSQFFPIFSTFAPIRNICTKCSLAAHKCSTSHSSTTRVTEETGDTIFNHKQATENVKIQKCVFTGWTTTKRVHYTQNASDVPLAVVFSGVNENEKGKKTSDRMFRYGVSAKIVDLFPHVSVRLMLLRLVCWQSIVCFLATVSAHFSVSINTVGVEILIGRIVDVFFNIWPLCMNHF